MYQGLPYKKGMMEEPQKKMKWPWWVWVLVILFPIPVGVGPWWVTVIFIAVFATLIWIIKTTPE